MQGTVEFFQWFLTGFASAVAAGPSPPFSEYPPLPKYGCDGNHGERTNNYATKPIQLPPSPPGNFSPPTAAKKKHQPNYVPPGKVVWGVFAQPKLSGDNFSRGQFNFFLSFCTQPLANPFAICTRVVGLLWALGLPLELAGSAFSSVPPNPPLRVIAQFVVRACSYFQTGFILSSWETDPDG